MMLKKYIPYKGSIIIIQTHMFINTQKANNELIKNKSKQT